MFVNIDIIIFISFLVINLVVGLRYGRKVTTLKDYALGDRNFSTTALVTTIIATWVSGGSFIAILSKTYSDGVFYVIAYCSMPITFLIIAFLLVPRMAEFLGNISVAEAMGNMYGTEIRIISAISGFIGSIGIIAIQLKVFGSIFNYFFGIPGYISVMLAGFVVVFYSTFGGIKAVTYTDILQSIVFSLLLPILGFIIWNKLNITLYEVSDHLNDPIFDYKQVLSFNNPQLISLIFLSLYFALPGIAPPAFQRIAMGRNIKQVKRAFIISSVILLVMILSISWIPFLVRIGDANIQPSQLLSYISDNYTYQGLKGLLIIGIMAMAMSTADSYLNASSVLFANDFCNPLKINFLSDLNFARIFTLISGILSVILAIIESDLLKMVLITKGFYMPIVTVPLLLAILGFRSTAKAVLIGMAAGFITVITFFLLPTDIDAIIPGMVMNLIFFMGSHYLLKQKGGWVGIKDPTPLIEARQERKRKIKRFIKQIKEFNLIYFCIDNKPKHDPTYAFFGLFCLISTIASIYLTHDYEFASDVTIYIYQSMLVTSNMFLLWYMWSTRIKHPVFIGFAWHFALIHMLVFCPVFFLLLSNFGKFELTLFTFNMLILFTLTRWQSALFMIVIGMIIANLVLRYALGGQEIDITLGNGYLNIIYVLLLMSTALITFIKPKQDEYELTQMNNEYLRNDINDKKTEYKKAISVKDEFIRNIQSEMNNPLTGIVSMLDILNDCWDKLDSEQQRKGLQTIASSSESLRAFVSNIIDLSKLPALNLDLKKQEINLSDILHDRIDNCFKLYGNEKIQTLDVKVENDILLKCDKYYMSRVFDNMIINALQYCKKGDIHLRMIKKQNKIHFSIKDEGIGIPKDELISVFDSFRVSSKTYSQAGTRGIGLTLCKKVVELHGGSIWARNNVGYGVTFYFTIPV